MKIRSGREPILAIARRTADFILEYAQPLRDGSSQQLATALRISQSGAVESSRKPGFDVAAYSGKTWNAYGRC